MAEDAVILFIEGVDRPPGEGDPAFQQRRVGGQRDVLPGRSAGVAGEREPRGLAELGMLGAVLERLERAGGEVTCGEVGHRVAPGLE